MSKKIHIREWIIKKDSETFFSFECRSISSVFWKKKRQKVEEVVIGYINSASGYKGSGCIYTANFFALNHELNIKKKSQKKKKKKKRPFINIFDGYNVCVCVCMRDGTDDCSFVRLWLAERIPYRHHSYCFFFFSISVIFYWIKFRKKNSLPLSVHKRTTFFYIYLKIRL